MNLHNLARIVGVLSLSTLTLLACSEGGESTTSTTTADPSIDEIERDLGFDVQLPTVLPDDVNANPRFRVRSDPKEVQISYFPRGEATGPTAPVLTIREITQHIIPADPNSRPIEIKGSQVVVDEFPGTTGTVGTSASMSFFWFQRGLSFSADFTWVGPGNTRLVLTDEMRAVALRVVESMIA